MYIEQTNKRKHKKVMYYSIPSILKLFPFMEKKKKTDKQTNKPTKRERKKDTKKEKQINTLTLK